MPKHSKSRLSLGNMRIMTVTPKGPIEFNGETQNSVTFSVMDPKENCCIFYNYDLSWQVILTKRLTRPPSLVTLFFKDTENKW